eukprot:14328651-Ditylum_brightwellii.AAC.1
MACHSFNVAVALVAINTRCTTVAVIVRSIGKGVHLVIAFFIATVVNLKITEVIKGVNSYLFFLFLLSLVGLIQGSGYFGIDKSAEVLVGYLICSAMSRVSFRALSATLQLKTVLVLWVLLGSCILQQCLRAVVVVVVAVGVVKTSALRFPPQISPVFSTLGSSLLGSQDSKQ